MLEQLKPYMPYIENVGIALITLVVGLWVIGQIVSLFNRVSAQRELDKSLSGFLGSLISIGLKVLLFISVASRLGIETTSFVAVLGAAGFAVGLALQGSLGNFAGGALIILFRPFKVGDLIEAQGHVGHVQEVQIFVTKLLTPDNKTAILPNGPLSNGNIVNYSAAGYLRVDTVVGISYDANIKQAREIIMKTLMEDPKVLKTPAPTVAVQELGGSSVDIAVRPYAKVADYWDVYFGTLESVKVALDKAGIEIPYPQQVVHHMNQA